MAELGLYAIVLSEPNNDAWERLKEVWPDTHHPVDDRLAFLSVGDLVSVSYIKKQLGLSVEREDPGGIIVRMNPGEYAGVLSKSAVTWLRKAESKRGE